MNPPPPVSCRVNGALELRLPGGTAVFRRDADSWDGFENREWEVRYLKKGLKATVLLHMSPVLTSRTL